MASQKIQNKIVWLASYPKSGNTWFRAFLTALMNDGDVAINSLAADGIFSDRFMFDYVTEIESRHLTDQEVKLMIADVYRFLASLPGRRNIIKVHDAFFGDENGYNIIPDDATYCGLYFVRNPLDIVGSLANHSHCSIQEAVEMMNSPTYCLAVQKDNRNVNAQFRQNISDWSSHVISWTERPEFPVKVVRYEDMLTDPFTTFSDAVAFMGWEATAEEVKTAIDAAAFERLSSQEAETGFFEKNRKSEKFFRAGKMGNWENELNKEQAAQIRLKHDEVMKRYHY